MDDKTVIQRCIDGDREVYEMLVKKYKKTVKYRFYQQLNLEFNFRKPYI